MSKPSAETLEVLRWIETEIGAGMVLLITCHAEQTWNNACTRALQIIENYQQGIGLFQIAPRTKTYGGMKDQDLIRLFRACASADWQQVALNGGPPCFHLEGERFCLRAERWDGHGIDHQFVSLGDLLRVSMSTARIADTVAESGPVVSTAKKRARSIKKGFKNVSR